MGMAASQARFLGLTARKNNVEFEGQQINQQRTALANQSANYYNDLLGMSVPVPPSVDSYTKTIYSFNDGALTNEITALISQPGSNQYKVSYIQQWEDDFAPVSAASSVIMVSGSDHMIGNEVLDVLGAGVPADPDATPPVVADFSMRKGTYLNSLTDEQKAKLLEEEDSYIRLLNAQYPTVSDWYVRYVENTSDGTFKPFFYDKAKVDSAIYKDNVSTSNINCYTIGSKTRTEEVKGKLCEVEKDATGRYINITIHEQPGDQGTKYSLTTSTITDQAAYEDAMNQYEFDKAKYDQAIQEINSKIEIIQAEDKDLELRLKQLDTEQDAISTEMDAVQKVIEKNTESTFKTFG